MISIPIIKSAIPNMRETKTAPAKGDTITRNDNAIARAPAPMLNPLAHPGLWLLPTPYTIWDIPTNNKPKLNIIKTNTAVDTGAATAMEPKIRASTPRPTAPHRDLFAINIPLIIFSIPTMIKIIPSMYIIETIVIPGCTKTNIDNIMATTPSPIATARFQPGDLDSFN
jgi:hypothetical protein